MSIRNLTPRGGDVSHLFAQPETTVALLIPRQSTAADANMAGLSTGPRQHTRSRGGRVTLDHHGTFHSTRRNDEFRSFNQDAYSHQTNNVVHSGGVS